MMPLSMASMLLYMKAVMAAMVSVCGLIALVSLLAGQKKMAHQTPMALLLKRRNRNDITTKYERLRAWHMAWIS